LSHDLVCDALGSYTNGLRVVEYDFEQDKVTVLKEALHIEVDAGYIICSHR